MTNKAERIRDLLSAGKKPSEIATELGCDPAYVRSVRQRMNAGGLRPCDMKWLAENVDKRRKIHRDWKRRKMTEPAYRAKKQARHRTWQREKYQTDAEWRAKQRRIRNERNRTRYQTDPEYRERCKAATKASHAARKVEGRGVGDGAA